MMAAAEGVGVDRGFFAAEGGGGGGVVLEGDEGEFGADAGGLVVVVVVVNDAGDEAVVEGTPGGRGSALAVPEAVTGMGTVGLTLQFNNN
jgi:hypothetical protein